MSKTRPKDVPLPAKDEVLLTRLEACRLARIGLSTFDRAVKDKRLRVSHVGRGVRVTREELNRFLGIDAPSA
jgi:excisionase family DNA binding protein